MLKKDFKYYLENQDKLVKKYNGRIIVIKDCKVIGDYSSELEALNTTKEKYKLGTFLIQKCEPGSESYTATYHSRFAFV